MSVAPAASEALAGLDPEARGAAVLHRLRARSDRRRDGCPGTESIRAEPAQSCASTAQLNVIVAADPGVLVDRNLCVVDKGHRLPLTGPGAAEVVAPFSRAEITAVSGYGTGVIGAYRVGATGAHLLR